MEEDVGLVRQVCVARVVMVCMSEGQQRQPCAWLSEKLPHTVKLISAACCRT